MEVRRTDIFARARHAGNVELLFLPVLLYKQAKIGHGALCMVESRGRGVASA